MSGPQPSLVGADRDRDRVGPGGGGGGGGPHGGGGGGGGGGASAFLNAGGGVGGAGDRPGGGGGGMMGGGVSGVHHHPHHPPPHAGSASSEQQQKRQRGGGGGGGGEKGGGNNNPHSPGAGLGGTANVNPPQQPAAPGTPSSSGTTHTAASMAGAAAAAAAANAAGGVITSIAPPPTTTSSGTGTGGPPAVVPPAALTATSSKRSKAAKKGGGAHFSRSYPRGVGVDFRKLSNWTLMSYIDHHGVSVRSGAPPSELAVGVARHFEAMDVDEEGVVGGFLARLSGDANGTDYVRRTAEFDGTAPGLVTRKRRRSKKAARPGEQVAAKVTRTDENGSWILASVQRFYADTETYDVQDEDDPSRLIRLPWNHVMRLSTGAEGCFDKGARVMAIFPETTSFYRAVVSKQPTWTWKRSSSTPSTGGGGAASSSATSGGGGGGGGGGGRNEGNNNNPAAAPIVKELIVKFEDDEDPENGHTPHRRVPSRYVIPVPTTYFFEDEDDIDLTPPGTSNE